MSVGPAFDLLLQGGRVIDPGSGTDGLRGVAIRNGKTAVVLSGVLPSSARRSWMLRVRSCWVPSQLPRSKEALLFVWEANASALPLFPVGGETDWRIRSTGSPDSFSAMAVTRE
jgi:hypothetical protein